MVRGRMRICLGAAPGVGETYAMLEEGQRPAVAGADVAVEPHGRRPTVALAEGLEISPRSTLEYRGTTFTGMDLDAVLARHPQVALVDELAHTNVPGSRRTKRWQDAREFLDAGIDVVTTLNVQHLESLGDVVRQITGVPQRETLPDEVARRADRPTGRSAARAVASAHAARRDLSLGARRGRSHPLLPCRQPPLCVSSPCCGSPIASRRGSSATAPSTASPWETRERIMVDLTGGPEGGTLIRRAARITARVPGSE